MVMTRWFKELGIAFTACHNYQGLHGNSVFCFLYLVYKCRKGQHSRAQFKCIVHKNFTCLTRQTSSWKMRWYLLFKFQAMLGSITLCSFITWGWPWNQINLLRHWDDPQALTARSPESSVSRREKPIFSINGFSPVADSLVQYSDPLPIQAHICNTNSIHAFFINETLTWTFSQDSLLQD